MAEKEIIVVDSQRVNMIQNCACKYDYTFNQCLVPIEKAEPLERGSLIHHMLEVYYKMRMYRGRWHTPRHCRNRVLVIDQKYIYNVAIKVCEHFAVKMSISIEEVDVTIRVFGEYLEYYWNEPHETLAVEQVGSRVMHEDNDFILIYETKIDWIFRLPNIPLMPADHKHSGRRGPVKDFSNQSLGYCWMLNVSNIMVNKIGFQTSIKPKDKFERPIRSYPKSVIEEWRTNTIWWVKMLRFHMKQNVWPRNFTSCDKYSGCIFQEVCITTPEARVFKIGQLFDKTDKPWDIGAKL